MRCVRHNKSESIKKERQAVDLSLFMPFAKTNLYSDEGCNWQKLGEFPKDSDIIAINLNFGDQSVNERADLLKVSVI